MLFFAVGGSDHEEEAGALADADRDPRRLAQRRSSTAWFDELCLCFSQVLHTLARRVDGSPMTEGQSLDIAHGGSLSPLPLSAASLDGKSAGLLIIRYCVLLSQAFRIGRRQGSDPAERVPHQQLAVLHQMRT